MNQEDIEAKQQEREEKKLENKRNAANNAQALRMAASIGQNVPEGTVQGVSKAVLAADKLTGGLSTDLLGHAMNASNKLQPIGAKQRQQAINKLMESDAGRAAAQAASIAASKAASNAAANNTPNTPQQQPKTPTNNQPNQPQNTPTPQQQPQQNQQKNSVPPNTTDKQTTSSEKVTTTSASSLDDSEEKKKGFPKILIITLIASFIPLILLLILIIIIVAIPVAIVASNPLFELFNSFQTITITDTKMYDGEIAFEDYIAGVIASDENAVNNIEYYKYIAIDTRTKFATKVAKSTVNGNDENFKYVDVETNSNSETIKKAVDATAGNVITKDDMIYMYDINATISKTDNQYYYIEYISSEDKKTNTIKISKDWEYASNFSEYLSGNNENYDLTKIIALYLITNKSYSYNDVIKYLYGDVTVLNANVLNPSETVNGFVTPVQNFSCSNGYGCRLHPIENKYEIHSGVDLGATSGEPVYAAKSGEIVSVQKNVPGYSLSQSYGNYITIRHEDGTQTRYAHLLYDSIPSKIYVGAKVTQGEMIGKVGSTGASTGPHLHYEVIVNGQNVNPYNYIDATIATNDPLQCNSNANTPMSYCGY